MHLRTFWKFVKIYYRKRKGHPELRFCDVIERLMLPAPHTGKKTGNIVLTIGNSKLDCVWNPPASNDGMIVLYSHGNGEYLETFDWWREEFVRRGYGFFGYDYEGYGASTGFASEKNMCADIEAAYNFLTETAEINPDRIVILGYSIGSVPSCHLAQTKKARGLILCAPVASGMRLFLPFSLRKDCFLNIRRVRSISMPLLIFHGDSDQIVPTGSGKILYRKAASQSKELYICKNTDHNDLFIMLDEVFWNKLNLFFKR